MKIQTDISEGSGMVRQVMSSSLSDPPPTTDHLWLTTFWFSAQQPEAGVGKKCASELTIFSHFTKFYLSAQPNPVGGKNVCPGIINFFRLQLQQIWVHEYKPKYHVPRFCSPTAKTPFMRRIWLDSTTLQKKYFSALIKDILYSV